VIREKGDARRVGAWRWPLIVSSWKNSAGLTCGPAFGCAPLNNDAPKIWKYRH